MTTSLKFRPLSERDYKRLHEDSGFTLDELNAMNEEEHNKNVGEAQGVMLAYVEKLVATNNDRALVQQIRDEIRSDERFFRHSGFIALLSQNSMVWTHSVIRSEARRADRSAGEHFEKMRLEREALRLAERAQEKAAVESLPTFGMF